MTFYKISSVETVAKALAETIKQHLAAGEQVFWLVSGGSSIAVASLASKLLAPWNARPGRAGMADSTGLAGAPLDKLVVSLTDERFGPIGHTDSNWRQLNMAGFELPRAKLLPILGGQDIEATTEGFKRTLEQQLAAANYRIGLFGIGNDGHTAGILPNSLAASSAELAACYDADPRSGSGASFTRITITPKGIARLDEAVAYATGEAKHPALNQLEQVLPLAQQPAQALKTAKKFSVYNDYKGEPL